MPIDFSFSGLIKCPTDFYVWVIQEVHGEIFFDFVVLAILLTVHTATCGPVN
jgi:hypothetical protein